MKKYTKLTEVQADLKANLLTCQALVKAYLSNIEAKKSLNAFLEVYEEEALEKARLLDEKIQKGENLGRLGGLIIGIKDVLCHKDHKVGAASNMLEGFESLFSATVIEKLLKEDAIIIGRLNCDEFAMGSTNEYSSKGPVLNAYDETKVSGGSSGGSAVAVQADLCLAALGSDTGGSVRQPASFCDVVGFKPTYGRISRHGLIAYASSFDQIGILAHSVEDTALILEVIAGGDNFDSTTSCVDVPAFTEKLQKDEKPIYKFAYFKEALENEGLDSEIRSKIEERLKGLALAGHEVEAVDFPIMEYMVPAYYVMTCAEASSNLSRYDGIHYAYRHQEAKDLQNVYTQTRTNGFGKEVKRRIMLGTFVLSAGFYDAYYTKAQKVRRLVSDETQKLLEKYDFIVSPTTPTTAIGLGELINQDPVTMYLADIYTVQANLVGMPAMSLPLFQHSNGMPFGLQLLANKFEEEKLLRVGLELMK